MPKNWLDLTRCTDSSLSEMFACPAVLIFQDDDLAAVYQTTMKHCVLIMDKFHDKNLVDLKSVLSQVELCDPILF